MHAILQRIRLTCLPPDAGLRGLRTLACQVLRTEVGGDPSRTTPLPATFQLPPGPVGHRTRKPSGINDKPESASIMIPNPEKRHLQLDLSLGALSGKLDDSITARSYRDPGFRDTRIFTKASSAFFSFTGVTVLIEEVYELGRVGRGWVLAFSGVTEVHLSLRDWNSSTVLRFASGVRTLVVSRRGHVYVVRWER